MRNCFLCAVFVAAFCTPAQAIAAPPSLKAAQAVLEARSECVTFTWLPNPKGEERGAITIPVTINGKNVPLQLDTGANATILYGSEFHRLGGAVSDAESFRAKQFSIGTTMIDRPEIYANADMTSGEAVSGTLGLAELVGKISVVDYNNKRFCLFADADLPALLREGSGVRATLRNGKLFVPIKVGEIASDAMVYDTGSSELPLHVDLALWKQLTGVSDPSASPRSFEGSSWGTKITLSGAPATSPVMMGNIELGRQDVFTNAAQPSSFAAWPFRADGVVGNAPFWDGIVVLDLTGRVRFSIFR